MTHRSAKTSKKGATSTADDFFGQLKQFKINNGYLLRMIDDGVTVNLSDEMKQKLYMTVDDDKIRLGGSDDDDDENPT